jgi:hypothetical protein
MKSETERHMLPRSTALGMTAVAALTVVAAAVPAQADPVLFIGLQEAGVNGGAITMAAGPNDPYGTFIHATNFGRHWPARPDLGLRWPSRLVATAAEDRLSFRRNARRKLLRRHNARWQFRRHHAPGLCGRYSSLGVRSHSPCPTQPPMRSSMALKPRRSVTGSAPLTAASTRHLTVKSPIRHRTDRLR